MPAGPGIAFRGRREVATRGKVVGRDQEPTGGAVVVFQNVPVMRDERCVLRVARIGVERAQICRGAFVQYAPLKRNDRYVQRLTQRDVSKPEPARAARLFHEDPVIGKLLQCVGYGAAIGLRQRDDPRVAERIADDAAQDQHFERRPGKRFAQRRELCAGARRDERRAVHNCRRRLPRQLEDGPRIALSGVQERTQVLALERRRRIADGTAHQQQNVAIAQRREVKLRSTVGDPTPNAVLGTHAVQAGRVGRDDDQPETAHERKQRRERT